MFTYGYMLKKRLGRYKLLSENGNVMYKTHTSWSLIRNENGIIVCFENHLQTFMVHSLRRGNMCGNKEIDRSFLPILQIAIPMVLCPKIKKLLHM